MVRLCAVCLVLLSMFLGACLPVHATADGWLDGDPSIGRVMRSARKDSFERRCSNIPVVIRDYEPTQACVTQMDGWRFAVYARHTYDGFERYFVVGFGSDTKMYVVDGLSTETEPLAPAGGNDLIYRFCCEGIRFDAPLMIYRDLPSLLEKRDGRYGVEYTLRDGVKPYVPSTDDARPLGVIGYGVSRSGEWVAAEAYKVGLVLVNTRMGVMKRFSDYAPRRESGYPTRLTFAVTDDGRTVFMGGTDADRTVMKVFDLTGCGDDAVRPDAPAMDKPCRSRSWAPLFDDGRVGSGYPELMALGAGETRLTVYGTRAAGGVATSFMIPGSNTRTTDYLGLGDSFASGEGDSELNPATGMKYYADYTDRDGHEGTPAEKCHQSLRSYPYVLEVTGAVPRGAATVACSGATTDDIAGQGPYDGQKGRLAVMTPYDKDVAQSEALGLFIPGRIRQADFVERYAPLVSTLGVGGNDVGFEKVLSACAHPWPPATCSYAADPADRRMIGEAIRGAYPRLRQTYDAVMRANPGMKLYVTGYPRFVDPAALTCPLNVNLDPAERRLIDEGVRYMNGVIRAAAASAGARYVDVEDAFSGHLLCGSGEAYANGISLFAGREKNESFHPNHLGQAALAKAIAAQTDNAPALYEYCPHGEYPCPEAADAAEVPTYFTDGTSAPPMLAVPTGLVALTPLPIGVPVHLALRGLQARSEARVELHSTAVDLGAVTAGDDGAVAADIVIPESVPLGYHTLHVYGRSPSGEPVDAFQIIKVGDEPDGQEEAVIAPMDADMNRASELAMRSDDTLDPIVHVSRSAGTSTTVSPAGTGAANLLAVLRVAVGSVKSDAPVTLPGHKDNGWLGALIIVVTAAIAGRVWRLRGP